MKIEKIRKIIIEEIVKKHPSNVKILSEVNEELDLLEITEGINDKNNLGVFFETWKKNKDKKGNKNIINSWTAYAIGMTSISILLINMAEKMWGILELMGY